MPHDDLGRWSHRLRHDRAPARRAGILRHARRAGRAHTYQWPRNRGARNGTARKAEAKTAEALGKEAFSKAAEAEGYEIVVDTHGTLLWGESAGDERPLLILTSEQVSKEYLAYLNGKHISWIACGKEHVDLKRACEILAAEFDVKRAAAVGGEHINAGFPAAGLLDEVSILIGAGIDGRGGMQSVFDGLPMERGVTPLKLTDRIADYGEFNIFPVFSGKPLA
ncbi:dihydrofolate reductase family protein [Hominicoprocola fusiformis]